MRFLILASILALSAVAQAQRQQDERRTTTTPVPILKQINKVNEDGSYTYGYENADGSYKIETKDVNGQVKGKYGYYDDAGQLREVEYGASRAGFYPQGTDIKAPEVAPPRDDPNDPQDGAYYPELYTYPYQHGYDPNNPTTTTSNNQIPQFGPRGRRIRVKVGRRLQSSGGNAGSRLSLFQEEQPQARQQPQSQVQQQYYQHPAPAPAPQQYQAQPQYQPQQYQPQQYQPQQYQQPLPSYYQQQPQAPAFNPAQLFQGHPARNIDLNTGSYSINYSG